MATEKIILISFLGALLELDTFFVGMTLLSQPIISGALAGLIFNNISVGISIGAIVQLIWILPPVGAFVPPSSSAIALTTTVMSLFLFDIFPEANKNSIMMFCMIIGVSFGYFIGQMDIWNRKLNTLIMHTFENQIQRGNIIYLFLTQLFSLSAKYLRDTISYLALFILGIPLFIKIFTTLPQHVLFGLKLAFWIVPVIGFAVIFCLMQTKIGSIFYSLVLITFYFIFTLHKQDIHYFLILIILISSLLIYNLIWKKREVKS